MTRMMRAVLLLALALTSCTGGEVPAPTAADVAAQVAGLDVGASGMTLPGGQFSWLPPIAPSGVNGAFDGALSPVVTICALGSTTCAGAPVARFTMASGPGSERLRLGDEHYGTTWHTREFALDASRLHRIAVSVDGLVLGVADVQLVATARDLKQVPATRIGVVLGRSLPIKFHIGHGIAARVDVTPAAASIDAGTTQQFAATVLDLHGEPLGASVTWASSSPVVATIDAGGLATGLATGTSTITASAGGVSGTATLDVRSRVVASVSITPAAASAQPGQVKTFTATVRDGAGAVMTDQEVSWQVTGPALLGSTAGSSVDVTGLAPGTATITASAGGKSASAQLVVSNLCPAGALVPYRNAVMMSGPPCLLRVTRALSWQAGAAWTPAKVKVSGGFEATFRFRMSSPVGSDGFGLGADGIAFVVQGQAGTAFGGFGSGIGYDGMARSVAVEFDTWYNSALGDVSSNHVGVQSGGVSANSVSHMAPFDKGRVAIPGDFNDGVERTVRITYVPGTLRVYLDGTLVLTSAINLTSINGGNILDAEGRAWVGFTGATGTGWANQDVLSFTVTP